VLEKIDNARIENFDENVSDDNNIINNNDEANECVNVEQNNNNNNNNNLYENNIVSDSGATYAVLQSVRVDDQQAAQQQIEPVDDQQAAQQQIEPVDDQQAAQQPKKRGRKRKNAFENINEIEDSSKKSRSDQNAERIAQIRSVVVENLKETANRMVSRSTNRLGEAKVGDNVALPVPSVDRGPGDLPNLHAYIIEINKETSLYRLATKHGIVKGWIARNQFIINKQKTLDYESLNLNEELSVRELNGKISLTGTQGFERCICRGTCSTNRCRCFLGKIKCNSKCHGNTINSDCKNCA
jgi:hypothetical protein